MTFPTACDPGSYCGPTVEQTSMTPCPEGTYNKLYDLQSVNECWDCKSGSYCAGTGNADVDGDCDAGHFCTTSAIVSNPSGYSEGLYGTCRSYHFCETGVGRGNVCEPGTFDSALSMTASTDCDDSIAGQFAHTVDITVSGTYENPVMTSGDCYEGYYCEARSSWPKHVDYGCQENEYCAPAVGSASTCGAGEYQTSKLQGECLLCPWGYECSSSASASNPTTEATNLANFECPAGYWCEEGTSTATNACPQGTYQPNTGAKYKQECIPAPPGFYIDDTISPATSFVDTNLCTAGFFCKLGSWTPTPGITGGDPDPAGIIYSDYGGECTIGNFCPEGSPVMIPCTPGYMCETTQMDVVDLVPCPAGYYCEVGTNESTVLKLDCPPGFYCEEASPEPVPCPAGTYSSDINRTMLSQCIDCTVNYYCDELA